MLEGKTIPFAIGELNSVIGEDGMDLAGHCRNHFAQELCGIDLPGTMMRFDIGKSGRTIDRDEEIDFPFLGAHSGIIYYGRSQSG